MCVTYQQHDSFDHKCHLLVAVEICMFISHHTTDNIHKRVQLYRTKTRM